VTGELQPVVRQVLAQAERSPDKPAIIADGRTVSYAGIASTVFAAAAALKAKFGVQDGDRVALAAQPHADFVCVYFAAHAAGAVCVPFDPQIGDARFAEIVNRAAPLLIVSDSVLPDAATRRIGFDELTGAGQTGSFEALADFDFDAPADILFTTGTTGRPKGVVLSHRALATACSHINSFIGTRNDSVEVLPLPLSHSFGLGRVRSILSIGATLVLVPGFVGAARILAALREFRATGFASVPSGIAILLSDQGTALSRFAAQLQYIEIGSSAMPIEHKRRLMAVLPDTRICMHYGLTEASRSAFLSFHNDADRLGSIGRPSPGVDLRVVDESGRAVGDGVDGEIEIRGGHLMSGYWREPELTADTLRDGWLRTGDLGSRDTPGYYHLKARSGDIINVGGRKVAPTEIEAILETHPGVAECVCVGVPDPQGLSGEMISAFLVAGTAKGELPKFSELATLLRQALEPYKIPRKFTWIDEVPRSSSGKVLRTRLRAEGK